MRFVKLVKSPLGLPANPSTSLPPRIALPKNAADDSANETFSTRKSRTRVTLECVQLVEKVVKFRVTAGDGLNDAEFTQLMLRRFMGEVDGFAILCFSDGCLTLSVPNQNLDRWHAAESWIAPEKEAIARAIGEKYDLTLCEPPDHVGYILPAPRAHHIELITRWETLVVAHPLYLKIRLFSTRSSNRITWAPKSALPPAPPLMRDLVALYR